MFNDYVELRPITERMRTAYDNLTYLESEEYLTNEQRAKLRVVTCDLCALFRPVFARRGELADRLTALAEEVKKDD